MSLREWWTQWSWVIANLIVIETIIDRSFFMKRRWQRMIDENIAQTIKSYSCPNCGVRHG